MKIRPQILAAVAAIVAISFVPASWAQDMSRNVPSATDTAWTQRVSQASAAEIRLAELARLRTSNQAVRDLAQKLSDDHGKASDELKQIASRKGIPLPAATDAKREALYDRLSKLNGLEFDQAYASAMYDEHRADIADFQQQADSGGDPDLKSFAIKTLPILQEHLRITENLLSQIQKK